MIASGARIVTNFSSNMHLRSGLAPIAAAHQCGCAIAVGVDGLALDEDDDVLREMRLVQMMHGGLGFKRNGRRRIFGLAIANGRKAPGRRERGVAAGRARRLCHDDLDRLDRDQIMPVDPIDLCSRGQRVWGPARPPRAVPPPGPAPSAPPPPPPAAPAPPPSPPLPPLEFRNAEQNSACIGN